MPNKSVSELIYMSPHHKRQGSNGSFNSSVFNMDQNPLQTSFSSLENFMTVTKQMEEEIMVPSKLKDRLFIIDKTRTATPQVDEEEVLNTSDVLEHYCFIRLIRNQFLECQPFTQVDENKNKELKNKNFKKTLDQVKYHYTELMAALDTLSLEAKDITDIYKLNV